ncbi:MAG: 1,4-dihydroxy-2-naphthoate octaprenyltransferase [Tannerellaceae bacterium]|nr:1,4-dihydroxy-2-naphthoate octaprenyltransferase [Tannerellaceae bacterium]
MNRRLYYWLGASRPFTLPASISPTLIGSALALRDNCFRPLPAILCLLIAMSAQIASNFGNDYFDYRKGSDTSARLGPPRAVASGWITPRAMLRATIITILISCLCGLWLVALSDLRLILLGVAIIAAVFAYSAGPWPLSRNGLGDLCVLVFYGIVPVCFTYYVQAMRFGTTALFLGTAIGLLSVNILVVNNCRDYDEDFQSGKRTTIVIFGQRFGRLFYLFNNLAAMFLLLPMLLSSSLYFILPYIIVGAVQMHSWRKLCKLSGKDLIPLLAQTSRNLLLYTILAAGMAIAQ